MFFNAYALCVERCGEARRSVMRILLTLGSLVVFAAPLVAQEAGGEENLTLPPLDTVNFLGGISGSSLLMVGLLVSALGMVFGLIIYMRLKNMPVHDSMREVSELIS